MLDAATIPRTAPASKEVALARRRLLQPDLAHARLTSIPIPEDEAHHASRITHHASRITHQDRTAH
jgi:hypothetical protein